MERRLFLILLTLTAIMMVGCVNQEDVAASIEKGDFATIEYDSCEYLLRMDGYQGFLAHKGNCKYCQERIKKMIKEVKDE